MCSFSSLLYENTDSMVLIYYVYITVYNQKAETASHEQQTN